MARRTDAEKTQRENKQAAQKQAFKNEWNDAEDNTERKHACYSQYSGCALYCIEFPDFKRVVQALTVGGMGDEAGAVIPDNYLQL